MSQVIGAGAASGGAALLPEVLAFSSSLALDKQLLREDLVGSLAHLIMLARTGIVPRDAARAIRAELIKVREADLPDEEDVHMAVEALLTHALGETRGLLRTAPCSRATRPRCGPCSNSATSCRWAWGPSRGPRCPSTARSRASCCISLA